MLSFFLGTIYDLLYGIIPGVLFIRNLPYKHQKESSNHSLSDEELVSVYRENQQKQLIGVLFDRYIHLVFASCMNYFKNEDDAQDAAMVIFESLPDKLLKFEVEYFKSWLFVITRNYCLMQLRKKNIIQHIDNFDAFQESFVENEDDLHLSNAGGDDNSILLKCLSELKEEQKICIELMYLQALSYKAIVEKTGFELKQVKSHIQNGKRNLKLKLEQYYEGQSRT
jgi:RNA polymerase sigma-70 factor (ECF subfamily)